MSTIKISELATSNIALTDFFAKADATGLANKNTVQELSNLLRTVDDTAFKGSIAIADVPSENGWYFASESGTYTNCGGLVIDTTDNIAIIIVSGTFDTFNKIDIPVNITIDATPTDGSTNAVQSGGVVAYTEEQLYVGSKNLFNKDTITDGIFIADASGAITNNASYYTSDFIPIEPSTAYVAVSERMNFYTSAKVWISGNRLDTSVSPSNAYFCRISMFVSSQPKETTQFELGTTPTSYVAYVFPSLSAKIKSRLIDDIVTLKEKTFVGTLKNSTAVNVDEILVEIDSLELLKGETIKKLHQEELQKENQTILALPFFNTVYNSATEIQSTGLIDTSFVGTNGLYNSIEGTFNPNGLNKYITPNEVILASNNNYICIVAKNIQSGDQILLSNNYDDLGGYEAFYIMKRASNITVSSSSGESCTFATTLNNTDTYIIQIVTINSVRKIYLNGVELVSSSQNPVNFRNARIKVIGERNTKPCNAEFYYIKAQNITVTNDILNKDLEFFEAITEATVSRIYDSSSNVENCIVLMGQSNADGRGIISELTDNYYLKKYDVKKWSSDNLNTSDLYVDSEILWQIDLSFGLFDEFLKVKREDNLNYSYIKQAEGGTAFFTGYWKRGGAGYDGLLTQLKDYKRYTEYNDITVKNYVFVFSLGENDGDDTQTTADAYEANLLEFLTNIQADAAISLKLIISRLPNFQSSTITYLTTIQTAQDNVAASNANYDIINTNSYTQRGDNLHFNSIGLTDLGKACTALIKLKGWN